MLGLLAFSDRLPKYLIYVSCNPATLARDLKLLCADGLYKPEKCALFDMFPRPAHFECVALLQRMSNTRKATITLDVEMEDYHRIKGDLKDD